MASSPAFLVWNPTHGLPRYPHTSVGDAKAEAERLAKQNPGQSFFVMAPVLVAECAVSPVSVGVVNLAAIEAEPEDITDDHIPF